MKLPCESAKQNHRPQGGYEDISSGTMNLEGNILARGGAGYGGGYGGGSAGGSSTIGAHIS
jgi:hypothetical protein